MTNEEEFTLFKSFILPHIEFKKGGFVEYEQVNDGFGRMVYKCKIGTVISKEQMEEYYHLINNYNFINNIKTK